MTSRLDLAARSPDEAAFLASIVADLSDDLRRLVYADWLDERDDPRGDYLRRFVQSVRSNSEVPDPDGLPANWLAVTGVALEAKLRVAGLTARRSEYHAAALPMVALSVTRCDEGDIPPGGTKFGGRPHLPAGAEWPRADDGSPLSFVAQFDLSEVAQTVAGRQLPPDGLLSFFLYNDYANDELGNTGRGTAGGARVVHTDPGAGLSRLEAPDELDADRGGDRPVCRVTLSDALDAPEPKDVADKHMAESIAAYQRGEGFLGPQRDTRFGPDQPGPFPHHLFGHTRGTVCVTEDIIPGPDWLLLARFGSDDTTGLGWGDGHPLFWHIRADDLRARNFARTTAVDG